MIPTIIVEDEFLVRLGLKTAIDWAREGFEIVGEAANGADGLALFLACRPRLVVTDIKMSMMDGLTLMREIRAVDPDVCFIVLTAHNEFSFAHDSIEIGVEGYLLKGAILDDELYKTLRRVSQKLAPIAATSQPPMHSQNGLALSTLSEKEILVRDLLPCPDSDTARFVCIRLSGTRDSALCKSFLCIAENTIGKMQLSHALIHHERYFIAAVSPVGMAEQACERIGAAVQRYLGITAFCGISLPAGQDTHAGQHAMQAQIACNRNLLGGSTTREYKPGLLMKPELIDPDINTLYAALLEGDEEESMAALGLLKEKVCESGSMRFFNYTLHKLVLLLARFDESLIETDFFEYLLLLDRVGLIFEQLEDAVKKICARIFELMPQSSLHIEKARAYIQENIHCNIKLRDVSSHIHLSPNYLGKLFYNETGMYLTNYIMAEKLSVACRLLRESDVSVAEVSQRVGFTDQQYFSKLFKKKMGMAPKEYMRAETGTLTGQSIR